MHQPPKRFWQNNAEHWRFFRQWLRNPLAMAAVAPSSPFLARGMVAEFARNTQRVIELGAGTGAMTRAILEYGIAPANLLALELNLELARHLRQHFPEVQVLCADARHLASEAERIGYAQHGPADAIISSLGLLSMPAQLQHDILAAAFECLKPDGKLIQFTYGPRSPVRNEVAGRLGLHVSHGATVLRNVPPARVFVYTRSRSRAIAPRSMR